MKTKKKLLIGTAIMALAAGGASAVSTFAWFKVTAGGTVEARGENEGVAITSATPSSASSVELPLNIEIHPLGNPASQPTLELVSYMAANTSVETTDPTYRATAGWYHAYLDNNGVPHYSTTKFGTGTVDFIVYEIVVTVPADVSGVAYTDPSGQTWSNEQIATKLNGRAISVTANRDLGTTGATKNSRAMFFPATASTEALPTDTTDVKSANFEVKDSQTLSKDVIKAGGAGHKFYVGVYVDGEEIQSNDYVDSGTTNVVGDFIISIADVTPVAP